MASGSSDAVRTSWKERFAQAQTTAANAITKEREGDLGTAYSLCIQTAQTYLWLIRNTNDENTKATLKNASARVLARAEKIKAVKRDVKPATTNCLDELEQADVLEASSHVRNARYPIWTNHLPAELASTVLYSDRYGHFPLSSDQQARLGAFRRITELSAEASILADDAQATGIEQNCVTDCSVVTALIACLLHHRKFNSKLGISCLYPQNSDGYPRVNPQGQYLAKLYINGIPRQITIDDFLPVSDDGSLLCATMSPSSSYWAALLEKAYIRVHGGYQIRGSDPSLDIYAYTGWIPEQQRTLSTTFRSEQAWKSISEGFASGTCLVTLGTGEKALQVPMDGIERELASRHAFAVTGMRVSDNGERYIDVVDPWNTERDHPKHGERQLSLSWHYVCGNFESIYLNWDPQTFEHEMSVHAQSSQDEAFSIRVNMGPSASMEPDEVWFLFTKHLDLDSEAEYCSLQVQEQSHNSQAKPQRTSASADYSNASQILVKHTPERSQASLSLFVARRGRMPRQRFTLSVFSNCAFALSDDRKSLPYAEKVSGKWTSKSAGGNPSLPTFIHNPHYSMDIPQLGGQSHALQATLSSDQNIPVNLKLIRVNNGQARIQQLETCLIVADSNRGAYTRGIAHLAVENLLPGAYMLLPSTFASRTAADFVMSIKTSWLCEPKLLPPEDAGKFTKTVSGTWTSATSGGGPAHPNYVSNPRYGISAARACTVCVRLQLSPYSDIPINVSIFRSSADNPLAAEVASSGPYASYVAGVTTRDFQIRPAGTSSYYVVPSTYMPGVQASFIIATLSDQPLQIEAVL